MGEKKPESMTRDNPKTELKLMKGSGPTVPSGYKTVPPDGKYGWVVAFGAFLSGLVSTVALTMFPVILIDLCTMYGVNTATVSWLPSTYATMTKLSGPLNAVIINAFGCRKSAMFGSLAISTGLISSFFVNRIEILCLTYGALTGFGTGLCLTANFVMLSEYFRKYLGITIGILMASFSASRLLLTPLTQYLLQEYGCRGVLLLMGAISMHGCVGAALLQPSKWHSVLVPINADDPNVDIEMKAVTPTELPRTCQPAASRTSTDQDNLATTSATAQNVKTCLLDISEIDTKDTNKGHLTTPPDCEMSEDHKSCAETCLKGISGKLDMNLLREPLFYLVSVSEYLVHNLMVFSNVFVFPFGIEKGIAPLDVAFVISVKSIFEIGSRIGTPSMVLFLGLSNRYTFIGVGILHGLLMFAAGTDFINTFVLFFAWALSSGFAFGGICTLNGVLITNTMGAQRLSSVIGLSNFINGFFFLPMAPALGWLRDQTGSFGSIYTIFALLQFLLVFLWTIKPLVPIAKNHDNVTT